MIDAATASHLVAWAIAGLASIATVLFIGASFALGRQRAYDEGK